MELKLDRDTNGKKEHDQDQDPNESCMKKPMSYIYRDDVVRSKTEGKIGIVTKVAGDSDSDSSSDDEGDDEKLAGHVRVLWMDESETSQSRDDVSVLDRHFKHGDYVAAACNASGQVGVVVDVNLTVDLSSIDGNLIDNISSNDLKRVGGFQICDYVVLGRWLGRIDDVFDDVTVMFDDGSVCKVMKADLSRLKPVFQVERHYPGQKVKASSSSVFKNARWISGRWKASRLEATVTDVTAGWAFVHWIASAGHGPDSSIKPSEEQNPKNLKLLPCFSHANWQLGHWCLLPSIKSHEEFNKISEPLIKNNSHQKKVRKTVVNRDNRLRKEEGNYENALRIINKTTRVDVAWQDGSIERGLDSISLISVENRGDHEFIPEEYVVEKRSDGNGNDDIIRRVGVVKSVNAKERTACVRWLKSVTRAADLKEFVKEEIVSVYELEAHEDYEYCYGDVVVRFSGGGNLGELTNGDEVKGLTNELTDLSWVGNITGLRRGNIEVTWADGMVSMVGPQAIYVVDCDGDDDSVAGGSDAASWETVEDTKMEDLGMQNDGEENRGEGNGALSIPRAAFGILTRLASEIFSRNSTINNGNDNEILSETPEESNATKNLNVEYEVDDSRFKGFDIVNDPLDHYYLGSEAQKNAGRKWLKKVQQDWDILKKNLPAGIYVRAYENRMDLLRGVIVGAYGTPYQDGLFFFDFHLPSQYPGVPPSTHYHSGGWKINPNLDEGGDVCLSLLNTWSGTGNEVWNPSSSTILQILVSLQGLVLNSKPYFNEAGYDKQLDTPEGEKNSLSYNENTFLLNCKTIMCLIRRPPKDFEHLVKDHFRQRGYHILKACDAYMKGYLIGSLTEDASVCETSVPDANSVGFKLMLAKIVPKLISSLDEFGANCLEFKHLKDSS